MSDRASEPEGDTPALSTGAVTGIVFGVIIGVLVILLVILLVRKRRFLRQICCKTNKVCCSSCPGDNSKGNIRLKEDGEANKTSQNKNGIPINSPENLNLTEVTIVDETEVKGQLTEVTIVDETQVNGQPATPLVNKHQPLVNADLDQQQNTNKNLTTDGIQSKDNNLVAHLAEQAPQVQYQKPIIGEPDFCESIETKVSIQNNPDSDVLTSVKDDIVFESGVETNNPETNLSESYPGLNKDTSDAFQTHLSQSIHSADGSTCSIERTRDYEGLFAGKVKDYSLCDLPDMLNEMIAGNYGDIVVPGNQTNQSQNEANDNNDYESLHILPREGKAGYSLGNSSGNSMSVGTSMCLGNSTSSGISIEAEPEIITQGDELTLDTLESDISGVKEMSNTEDSTHVSDARETETHGQEEEVLEAPEEFRDDAEVSKETQDSTDHKEEDLDYVAFMTSLHLGAPTPVTDIDLYQSSDDESDAKHRHKASDSHRGTVNKATCLDVHMNKASTPCKGVSNKDQSFSEIPLIPQATKPEDLTPRSFESKEPSSEEDSSLDLDEKVDKVIGNVLERIKQTAEGVVHRILEPFKGEVAPGCQLGLDQTTDAILEHHDLEVHVLPPGRATSRTIQADTGGMDTSTDSHKPQQDCDRNNKTSDLLKSYVNITITPDGLEERKLVEKQAAREAVSCNPSTYTEKPMNDDKIQDLVEEFPPNLPVTNPPPYYSEESSPEGHVIIPDDVIPNVVMVTAVVGNKQDDISADVSSAVNKLNDLDLLSDVSSAMDALAFKGNSDVDLSVDTSDALEAVETLEGSIMFCHTSALHDASDSDPCLSKAFSKTVHTKNGPVVEIIHPVDIQTPDKGAGVQSPMCTMDGQGALQNVSAVSEDDNGNYKPSHSVVGEDQSIILEADANIESQDLPCVHRKHQENDSSKEKSPSCKQLDSQLEQSTVNHIVQDNCMNSEASCLHGNDISDMATYPDQSGPQLISQSTYQDQNASIQSGDSYEYYAGAQTERLSTRISVGGMTIGVLETYVQSHMSM